jgi:thiamine biosynthesis lipoprotein
VSRRPLDLAGDPPAATAPAAPTLERVDDYHVGRFRAFAGPCEMLADTCERAVAERMLEEVRDEALRIERKFSRYRTDSVVHAIHAMAGAAIEVDDETASLIDYAATCHAESGGRFDITSGVLRRVWTFDGGTNVPTPDAVARVLALVGWSRVTWERPRLSLPAGMEIDLGGIGKEYAVDRAALRLAALRPAGREVPAFLVNFGGDLFASGPRGGGRPWIAGVDDPERSGLAITHRIELTRGGVATSGDARRYVMHEGRRLGHILDPRTGWPVEGAPRSVTVFAATCLEAGTLATFAVLHGPAAREFLEGQGVLFEIG